MSTAAAQLECPRCGVALAAEIVGALGLDRCGACGGVWLDPDTFRAVCEGETRPRKSPPGQSIEDGALSSGGHGRVTYLRCPVCQDVMNRVNFARVSGVIIDTCRQHGAWFDAGELRAVRKFVRGSGLGRFARRRQLERERDERPPAQAGNAGIDLIDELAGIPDRWDVPSKASTARRFVRAAILAVVGGAMLWGAFFASYSWRGSAGLASLGGLLLLAALRALGDALDSRARGGAPPKR